MKIFQLNWKSTTALIATVIMTAWTTIVAFGIVRVYDNERRITALELKQTDHTHEASSEDKLIQQQINDLRRDVELLFTIESQSNSPTARPNEEKWKYNRDEEFRKRLDALEQFRLLMENKSSGK